LPSSTRDAVAETLATSSKQLAGLADVRSRYDDPNSGVQRDEVVGYYSAAISELLVLNTRVGSGSRDTELVGRASTLASFSQAKEASAQQRGYVVSLLYLGGSLPPQATQQITQIVQSAAGAESAWLSQFRTTAMPDE
nr:nitrate- and nitrite sensing domain-containing protein [Micromonospora sp. DSM 115978]